MLTSPSTYALYLFAVLARVNRGTGFKVRRFEVPPVDGIEVFQLIRGGEYRTVVAVGSAIFGVENYFWVWLAHCRDHH